MQNRRTTLEKIEELTARCEMLARTKVQLEALAQMHRRMYAEAGPALGSLLAEEMNRALERIEQAKGTIDSQLFDHRSELLDEIEPGNEQPEGDDDLDALPILCDCGMEWDPSCYDRCPDCAELVEIAECTSCNRIFAVDLDSDEQTKCPSCDHNDRIYRKPITRGKLRAMIESGDALEAKKAVQR
jgi:phage FluMu protein Com